MLKITILSQQVTYAHLILNEPQEKSSNILKEFLLQHGYSKVKGIPIYAIRKLDRLVITENVFIYEKKFYRQIIGGAMGSVFALTLANIFMRK
jgi:hypothetical protein